MRALVVVALVAVACSTTTPGTVAGPTGTLAASPSTGAAAAASPAPRFDYALAFDTGSRRAVMFGGFLSQQPGPVWTAETWSYDTASTRWQLMRPAVAPSERHYPAMVYDAESDLIVLFGGALPRGRLSGETWTYNVDTDTWKEMRPGNAPSPRSSWAGAVYDPVGDRVILHGGWIGDRDAADTWAYDVNANTWTKLAEDGPRGSSLVYDGLNRRVLAFGGAPEPGRRSADMWIFKLGANTWEQLTVGTTPSARSSPMQYASVAGKIVLFGGSTPAGEIGETWTFDLASNTWAQHRPDLVPSPRHGFKLAYEPRSNTMILFGGGVGSRPLGDTWTYDVAKERWVRVHGG